MPTDGSGPGFSYPYYPIETNNTALYNISETLNRTALDRLIALEKVGNNSQFLYDEDWVKYQTQIANSLE